MAWGKSYRGGAAGAHDVVRKVRVEAHAGRNGHREVCAQAHHCRPDRAAGGGRSHQVGPHLVLRPSCVVQASSGPLLLQSWGCIRQELRECLQDLP